MRGPKELFTCQKDSQSTWWWLSTVQPNLTQRSKWKFSITPVDDVLVRSWPSTTRYKKNGSSGSDKGRRRLEKPVFIFIDAGTYIFFWWAVFPWRPGTASLRLFHFPTSISFCGLSKRHESSRSFVGRTLVYLTKTAVIKFFKKKKRATRRRRKIKWAGPGDGQTTVILRQEQFSVKANRGWSF